MSAGHQDKRFMRMAIDLAKEAQGRTHPNPLVGCVIVRKNKIVGRGCHVYADWLHAEVLAIQDARCRVKKKQSDQQLKDCTLYVTLEPPCKAEPRARDGWPLRPGKNQARRRRIAAKPPRPSNASVPGVGMTWNHTS